MNDDALMVQLGIEESQREAFQLKLDAIRRSWPAIRDGQLPDRRQLKEKLEQYFASVEKTLRLAREIPPELISLPSDSGEQRDEPVAVFEGRAPVAPSRTEATAWTDNPPHPVDYLQYLLAGRLDLVASLKARELDPTANLELRSVNDLLPSVPRKDVYPFNWLLNQLLIPNL